MADTPEPEFKLDDSVTERDLLFRIYRELVTLRKQNTELVGFYRDAEKEIPEFLRRFANYFHDMHDVKFVHEEHGQPAPKWILDELERCDDRMRQILKALHAGGGALEKVRRQMAEEGGNRYDHTRQLSFDRSKE